MKWTKRRWQRVALVILVALAGLVFGLGLHRKPRYIQNFEEEEYGQKRPFVDPAAVIEGLAVYSAGEGEPILLFPYPHAHTTEPMVQGALARAFLEMGRRVITFDVPGAYRSTREPTGEIDELLQGAEDTLAAFAIEGPVDVVGHSMGGLAALAFAVERPERTNRLVLVTSMSGFPSAVRHGGPWSYFQITEPDYWRFIFWGLRVNFGGANLTLHKKLQNLMGRASYYDKTKFSPVEIREDDRKQGVPIRMIWNQNMKSKLSYADRLGSVQAPTLVLAGRHDPQAPLPCSQELAEGIRDAALVVFESSGHYPFEEEPELFSAEVTSFLNDES